MKSKAWLAWVFAPALLWATAGAAESLGRLFFTPAQRHTFDSGKQLPGSNPAPVGPRSAQLNGVVTRSDGENTVWINGKPLGKVDPAIKASASSADPAAARVKLPSSDKTVRLKVGQRYLRSSGKIVEPYQRPGRNSGAPSSGTPSRAERASPGSDDGTTAVSPEPGQSAEAH